MISKKLRRRIRQAMKRETGLRLSSADVQGLGIRLDISFIGNLSKYWEAIYSAAQPPPPGRKPPIVIGAERGNSHIRWLICRDTCGVLAIANQPGGEYLDEKELAKFLRIRNNIGMVVEGPGPVGPILGFFLYTLHPECIVIVNMGVRYEDRRRGIGREIINKLKAKIVRHIGRRELVIMIDERQTGALQFLKVQGFIGKGVGGLVKMKWRAGCKLNK